jgi:hypothetical protein
VTEGPCEPRERAVEAGRLRQLFRFFAATQCNGRSLVLQTLSDGVAGSTELLDLLLATPGEQRRPALLFAAVNLLLASRPGSELAAYYPIHGGRRPVDDQLLPAFARFCAGHRDVLAPLLQHRSTQTNEIRRCVALRLGLDHVQRHWTGPVALAEVGAAAGLNLLFDRYRYRLGDSEAAGAAASPVVISCDVRHGPDAVAGAQLLGAMPRVTTRLGIDQHPVSLSDPDARAWLESFIWPEDVEGLAVLRSAIGVAASGTGVTVVKGEATTDTARLLAELPGDEPVAVFTASLLSYLTTQARTAFAGQLELLAARRPVAWIFAEGPGLLATTDLTIGALAGPLARRNSRYAVGVSLRSPAGHRHDQLLALADPYLRWLAPARGPADDFQWVG